MRIEYVIRRGRHTGVVCLPHLHEDGRYVVSRTRYERDYVRLSSLSDVIEHLHRGYRLRVSNPLIPTAPSLVMLRSLRIAD